MFVMSQKQFTAVSICGHFEKMCTYYIKFVCIKKEREIGVSMVCNLS